ncbi:hypothetical protein LCGC14_2527810 [marine sediment metagenome]|uniref:Uncharacterized protein n=1 Tax=marine sediment metagenome TaxID=412755 RepID=A0A0F9D648_9ZZZZ
MRIVEDVYLIGGGLYGVGISNNLDCNVFLVDGESEMALEALQHMELPRMM